MAVPLTIKVFQRGELVETHRCELDLIKIGRRLDADVLVKDEKVGRVHCVIRTEANGAVFLEDWSSHHGTHVRGQQWIKKIPLPFGEEILLGDTCLIVEKADA
ncbi:FHA domain-containing protein [Hyalangium gracile]|uniref:FHA domain-containing protein n=1 Tax=Hyalangium gracile TaxID=394092 RepID=UPI001CC94413|nr:FHA domain-containing protein [Hyalangium gracile]